MPTDKLTRRSTTLDRIEKEKMAAAVRLITPAIAVVNKMESKVE